MGNFFPISYRYVTERDPHWLSSKGVRLRVTSYFKKAMFLTGLLSGLVINAMGCAVKVTPIQNARLFSNLVGTLNPKPNSLLFSADPLYPQQWYLQNTGQESKGGVRGTVAADIRFTRADLIPNDKNTVVVAVIDSGIDLSHPDLAVAQLYFNPGENGLDPYGQEKGSNGVDDDNNGYVDDALGWSFASNSNDISDSLGHGTHVAGLLASQSNNGIGVGSPWIGFKVMPIQIFDARHPTADHTTIAQAMRYAVDNGAHIISASFGSSTPSETMREAVEYAAKNNVIVVSAVGNFRKNTDSEPAYPAHFGYSNQISVAASDRRDMASSFSNFGMSSVDVFAPGEEILSTSLNKGYATRSGTSQACPLVSVAIATAKYLNFNDTAEQIIERVLTAADELKGLKVFSRDSLRINVDNIIRNKEGIRLNYEDPNHWKSTLLTLESEHPYRSNVSITHAIVAPENSKQFRVHFKNFSTQSTDIVELMDSNHIVITSLSGELGTFWSPAINGNLGHIKFTTDRFVSDYGWTIDQLSFLE